MRNGAELHLLSLHNGRSSAHQAGDHVPDFQAKTTPLGPYLSLHLQTYGPEPSSVSRRNFHNLVFKLLSFPDGMFRARNRGTATAQPKASALQPQLVWRGGSGSPLTATSAPLVLFLALHRRLRFPRRLQALWEANVTPVYGGCQYFNAIYCISILTCDIR